MRAYLLAGLAALSFAVTPKQAAGGVLNFDFSYTSSSDVAGDPVGPIDVTGALTTTDVKVAGYYTVLSITGSRDGVAITSLGAAHGLGENDNLFRRIRRSSMTMGWTMSLAGWSITCSSLE